jgi:hypothetical protein
MDESARPLDGARYRRYRLPKWGNEAMKHLRHFDGMCTPILQKTVTVFPRQLDDSALIFPKKE